MRRSPNNGSAWCWRQDCASRANINKKHSCGRRQSDDRRRGFTAAAQRDNSVTRKIESLRATATKLADDLLS